MTSDPFAPLRDPGLTRLWVAIRKRLENNHVRLTAVPLVMKGLDVDEIAALCGLLGRRRPDGDTMKVDLRQLDELLRVSAVGRGLVEVLEAVDGPVRDRAGERLAKGEARLTVQMETDDHPAIDDPAVSQWVASVRRRGVLTRLANGGADVSVVMRETLDGLRWLQTNGPALRPAPIPLSVLAAGRVGDAHALDGETAVGSLLVDALTSITGAEDPRAAWAAFGVQLDQVNSSALVLNLPGAAGSICRSAADHGEPLRITWRMIERGIDLRAFDGLRIRVCENPSIVSVAADSLGPDCAPLICTEGMPGTATAAVLRMLAEAGADLRVHADFDFGGVAIVRHLIDRFGAAPWRMSEANYLAALAEPTTDLVREIGATDWSPRLADAMNTHHRAIHEEVLVSDLVDDLVRRT